LCASSNADNRFDAKGYSSAFEVHCQDTNYLHTQSNGNVTDRDKHVDSTYDAQVSWVATFMSEMHGTMW